jgi:putative nucleotidyltransferase with HDIG domain
VVLLKYISVLAAAALLPVLIIFYLAMRSWLGRLEDADTHVAALHRLYLSTVAALSTAIEAKDGVTSDHIHRVQAYAMGLARALAITDSTMLQAIEAAALLHDTGKIAVPEHILNKPGRLTAAEFETMKSHVDVGVDILSAIDFPYPVVPIVAAHHENWDGTGYPNRLRGEAIPIGARILSVVDCFDALTSDRPYRPAMSEAAAMAIIRQRSGNFYDPTVVATFERVYDAIAPTAIAQPRLQNVMRRIRRVREGAPAVAAAPERVQVESPGSDISEELLAFVSLARLASGTPSFGDIGALAWGHLRQVAPGATLALFIVDPIRHAVVARYTTGPGASDLAGLVIGIGERITGWVAANARTMVNADAALDLGREGGPHVQFATAIPLVTDGSLVGVMVLYADNPFPDDQTRRLEMIAPHLATSVAAAIAAETGMRPAVFAEVSRR